MRLTTVASDDQSPTPAGSRSWTAAWPYLIVLLAGAFVLLPALGSFGLWEPWEPRYAEAAREMRERGSLFVPLTGDEIRPADPPLTYEGILLGSLLFGTTETGARIGGAILALVTLWTVHYAVARLRGRRAGLLAALVCGSCPLFYFLARQAMPEAYLMTTAGMSLLFFCLALDDDDRRGLHCALGGLGLALALLARGPLVAAAAVVAPLAIYGLPRLFAVPSPRRSAVWRSIALAALVVLAVAGPWYAGLLIQHGAPHDFLLRVQPTPDSEADHGGFGDYLRGWIFGFFPWSCLLPLALTSLAGAWERGPIQRYGFEICLWLSATAAFVVISVPSAKFAQALAPVVIPVAVLAGLTLDRMLDNPSVVGARLSFAVAAIFYLPVMVDLLRERGLRYLLRAFAGESDVPRDFTAAPYFVALLALFALILLGSILVRSRILACALVLPATLLAGYNAWTLVPALSGNMTMKSLCAAWKAQGELGAPLGFYGPERPGARFYAEGRLLPIANPREFSAHLAPGRPAFCIVDQELLVVADRSYREEFAGQRLYLIDRSHADYVLVGNRKPPE